MRSSSDAIAAALKDALDLKGEDKLQALRTIRNMLHLLECEACRDFSFPLHDIRHARQMLPDVDTGIARIMGAKKAARTRAAAKR